MRHPSLNFVAKQAKFSEILSQPLLCHANPDRTDQQPHSVVVVWSGHIAECYPECCTCYFSREEIRSVLPTGSDNTHWDPCWAAGQPLPLVNIRQDYTDLHNALPWAGSIWVHVIPD